MKHDFRTIGLAESERLHYSRRRPRSSLLIVIDGRTRKLRTIRTSDRGETLETLARSGSLSRGHRRAKGVRDK